MLGLSNEKTISTKNGKVNIIENPIIIDNAIKGKYIKYNGKRKSTNFSGEKITFKDEDDEGKILIYQNIFASSNLPIEMFKQEEIKDNDKSSEISDEEIGDLNEDLQKQLSKKTTPLFPENPENSIVSVPKIPTDSVPTDSVPTYSIPIESVPENPMVSVPENPIESVPEKPIESVPEKLIESVPENLLERDLKRQIMIGGNKYFKKYLKYKIKYARLRNGIQKGGKSIFTTNIEKATIENKEYRKILHTGKNIQLVLMSLKVNEKIPKEKHNGEQFIRVESGIASVEIDNEEYTLKDNECIIIPSGSLHYVKNIGDNELKLYTIYSPPEH